MAGNQRRRHAARTSQAHTETTTCPSRAIDLIPREEGARAGALAHRRERRQGVNLSRGPHAKTRVPAMSRSSFEPDVEPAPEPPPATPEPDLGKLGAALRERIEIRSLAITGLFVLAFLYTIYFARAFLLPIVLAVLLDFLLSPLIRTLKRLRIPEPVSAGLVI